MSAKDSLTSHTLLDGAQMYAASADAINDKLPNSLHVLSHCLGTSIELTLKAFLLSHGYTEEQLKKLGHNLPKLLEKSCSLGLNHTGSRNFVLSIAGHNYKEKIFAYPRNANMNIIMPWRLRQMADELIRDVYIHLYGSEAYAECSNEQGLHISSKYPEDICASDWKSTKNSIKQDVVIGAPS